MAMNDRRSPDAAGLPHWCHGLPPVEADTAGPDAAAPSFMGFWRASELNPTRAWRMHQRIEEDAAIEHEAPRPVFAKAPQSLPQPDASVAEAWAARRSVRAFADRAVSLRDLSTLLWPMARRPDGGRGLASGGGKYPLQAHVVSWQLSDADRPLPPTLCWYDPLAHGLTPIAAAPAWEVMKPIVGVDMNRPAALMVVTAQLGPHAAKYGERGGRFMLLEAGSWLGAWQAETARLGLGGVVIGAFQDRALLRQLGPHVSGEGRAPGDVSSEHVVVAVYALGWPAP